MTFSNIYAMIETLQTQIYVRTYTARYMYEHTVYARSSHVRSVRCTYARIYMHACVYVYVRQYTCQNLTVCPLIDTLLQLVYTYVVVPVRLRRLFILSLRNYRLVQVELD